ncbi:MAG: gamma-glutamylcyclotransferase [Desulfuromonadaceae bacterium]
MLFRLTNNWNLAAEQRRRDIGTCAHFFFYGSLMERYENFMRYIKKRVLTIDVAYCRGILYHLPIGFPGLIVPEQGEGDLVVGEVMTVRDPVKVLKLLDRLEDYFPQDPQRSVYLRRLLPIIVETPGRPPVFQERQAWVYTYPADHLTPQHERQVRIECGQWKAFAKSPSNGCSPLAFSRIRQQRCFADGGRIIVEPALQQEALVRQALNALPCFRFCRNQQQCGYQFPSTSEVAPDIPAGSIGSESVAS